MTLDQILALLRETEDDAGFTESEGLLSRLATIDDDLSVRDAKIAELTSGNESLTQSVQDLKARNYDLLMQIPTENNSGDGEVEEVAEDEGEITHIDNLFVDDDEEK